TIEDYDTIADETRTGRPLDRPAQYHAAGHAAHLRHADHIADLRLSNHGLLERRVEHPDHRIANLLLDLVDDRVEPDVNILLLCYFLGARFRPHVEANDHRRRARCRHIGSAGQQYIRFGNRADTRANDPHLNLVRRELDERIFKHFYRALYVGL